MRAKGAGMRTALRLAFGLVVLVHGGLHLIGVSRGEGRGWLAGAVVVVAAGVLVLARVGWAWIVVGLAAVASEVLVVTSWSDAWAGTIVNAAMLLFAGHGLLARGPGSMRAQYRRLAAGATARSDRSPGGVITEDDLAGLPVPLADHLRACGVVGRPRVSSFRATIHGRIRGRPDEPWMQFTGEQVNTFGPLPERYFFIDATRMGLPVDVLHAFTDHATMRARLLSVAPLVDGAGPELDRTETVTLFNDMCLLAPGALLDADVTWQVVEDRRVRGTFRRGDQEVSADLVFDLDHTLVDFESEDRARASADGRVFTPTRWSTPVLEYADFDGRRLVSRGDAVWHAAPPEGQFAYLEFAVDAIAYDHGETARPVGLRLTA